MQIFIICTLTTHNPWAETANGRSTLLDWDHGENGNQKLVDYRSTSWKTCHVETKHVSTIDLPGPSPFDRRDWTVMAKRIFSDISTLNYCISANKKYSDKALKCECMNGLNLPKKSSELSKTQWRRRLGSPTDYYNPPPTRSGLLRRARLVWVPSPTNCK